jgi:hypothetical protein
VRESYRITHRRRIRRSSHGWWSHSGNSHHFPAGNANATYASPYGVPILLGKENQRWRVTQFQELHLVQGRKQGVMVAPLPQRAFEAGLAVGESRRGFVWLRRAPSSASGAVR